MAFYGDLYGDLLAQQPLQVSFETEKDVYKRQVLGSRASLVTSLVLLVVAIVLELAVLSVIRARTRAKTSGDAA